MSYYFTATLYVEPPIPTIAVKNNTILGIFTDPTPGLGYLGDMYTSWIDWEEDLRAFSLEHPGHLFRLDAYDDNGNNWISYFKDGKHQMCEAEITYPDYDPELLT